VILLKENTEKKQHNSKAAKREERGSYTCVRHISAAECSKSAYEQYILSYTELIHVSGSALPTVIDG